MSYTDGNGRFVSSKPADLSIRFYFADEGSPVPGAPFVATHIIGEGQSESLRSDRAVSDSGLTSEEQDTLVELLEKLRDHELDRQGFEET